MTTSELQNLILKSVPLTHHMGVEVELCSIEKVQLIAPLEKNYNHKNTAFGGSLTSLQALCCWSWIMNYLHENSLQAEVVLQNSESQFLLPGTEDLRARCLAPSTENTANFKEGLVKKGKARIELYSEVPVAEGVATKFTGRYVAFTI